MLAARRRRRRHLEEAEITIHRVRSKVLMNGLAAGQPMAHILSHPSMKNITAQELQAAAQACLAACEPPPGPGTAQREEGPAHDGDADQDDVVPEELVVPAGGPRRSMVRVSAAAAADAGEESVARAHLHRISMRLSTASYQERISRASSGGGGGREPRLTTFDPLAPRRISLMQEIALRRLSSTSSTQWTDEDDAEVARMSAEAQEAPAPAATIE